MVHKERGGCSTMDWAVHYILPPLERDSVLRVSCLRYRIQMVVECEETVPLVFLT